MSLGKFCDRVDSASTLDELWDASLSAFAEHEIYSASYHHFPPPGSGSDESIRYYAKGLPDAFIKDYIGQKLFLVDPIPGMSKSVTTPFFWRDALALETLTQPEIDFIDWMQNKGIRDGLAVRVFGPNGRDGMVGLYFDKERPKLSLAQIRELQAICQIGHMVYIQLTKSADTGVPLTKREREVLEWVAKGKSNSVIADIMGISSHTVDAYLRRIYLKLRVSDRISASVRGVGMGLITGFSDAR
jgi:LuxR family transcriptional regulator/LuxR family quorum-sensing system transcriptional regulator CciR